MSNSVVSLRLYRDGDSRQLRGEGCAAGWSYDCLGAAASHSTLLPALSLQNIKEQAALTGELQLRGWHSPLAPAKTHPRRMLTPEVSKQWK